MLLIVNKLDFCHYLSALFSKTDKHGFPGAKNDNIKEIVVPPLAYFRENMTPYLSCFLIVIL